MEMHEYFQEVKKDSYQTRFPAIQRWLGKQASSANATRSSWLPRLELGFNASNLRWAAACLLLAGFGGWGTYHRYIRSEAYVITVRVAEDSTAAHERMKSLPGMDTLETTVRQTKHDNKSVTEFDVHFPSSKRSEFEAWVKSARSLEGAQVLQASGIAR